MLVEMHLHTAETSYCALASAKDVIKRYHEYGYDGVVVTDHYSAYTFHELADASQDEKIDRLLAGYRAAKEEGDRLGIKVFQASEVAFCDSVSDYLVYGMTEEFLRTAPMLCNITLDEFLSIKPDGVLIYQAHPFRNNMRVTDPDKLFGVEVFNGHPGHNSRNSIASEWAKLHSLHMISGTDFHYDYHNPVGGLFFNQDVNSMEDIVEALMADNYTLKTK